MGPAYRPAGRGRMPPHPVAETPGGGATLKSILIAEGDERVAELFTDLFGLDGWAVTTHVDGQHAAAALSGRAPYDAVLVSNRLRDMGGAELIRRIRALDHRRRVPIVMVTGTCVVDVVAAALSAGADDVLYKPVDVNLLVTTVNKCLERRGPQDI